MKSVLLITGSNQSAQPLAQLLRNEGYVKITTSFSAYGAREEASQCEKEFDLICINAPLPELSCQVSLPRRRVRAS